MFYITEGKKKGFFSSVDAFTLSYQGHIFPFHITQCFFGFFISFVLKIEIGILELSRGAH